MTCIASLPIMVHERQESPNEKILNNLKEMPEKARKVLKLLAKQYTIESVEYQPPIEDLGYIIRENPHIVTYTDPREDTLRIKTYFKMALYMDGRTERLEHEDETIIMMPICDPYIRSDGYRKQPPNEAKELIDELKRLIRLGADMNYLIKHL